jgi:PAS domain S-box-containing protein
VSQAVEEAVAGATAGTPLPRVLDDVPAAVLLVDMRAGAVTYANPAGHAMLGEEAALPMRATRFGRLADVRRPDGARFADGESPVDHAAGGRAVIAEPVSVPGAGDGERRLRWVTGFPLPQDGGLGATALLVFFEVAAMPAAADDLRNRAVLAAGLSFSISDPSLPDNPLVWVNPAFERMMGYTAAQALGRNCRFLQSEDTDPAAVAELRAAVDEARQTTVTLLNVRADGTSFYNEVSLSPVLDRDGGVTHFVGVQADVTARVLAEAERERHLAAESAARAGAEEARRQLAVLAEATTVLAGSLDIEGSLGRLARLVVPALADLCAIEVVEADGRELRCVATAGLETEAELRPVFERLEGARLEDFSEASPVARVLATGEPVLVPELTREVLAQSLRDPGLVEAYERLGCASSVTVPLRAREQVFGALSLIRRDDRRAFTEGEMATVADLGRRAGLSLETARLFARQHAVAEQLQRSLLPQTVAAPGLATTARYLPAESNAQVGGDWYDVFALPDGAVCVVVGDVVGHDLEAASSMGQLRSIVRSYAWEGDAPGRVLERVDELVQGLQITEMATVVFARVERDGSGDAARLTYANAGHPPPLLRAPDGTVTILDGALSVLVGAGPAGPRGHAEADLSPGSVLLLYTDGLVERRDEPLDAGVARLAAAVAALPTGDPDALCDGVLAALGADRHDDDVALLAVAVDRP